MVAALVNLSSARLLVLATLGLLPCTLDAHQLDEYLQATLVEIEPNCIRLHLHLTPGVEVADTVLDQIDRDGDGTIASAEANAYGESMLQDLTARLDGRDVRLHLSSVHVPPISELRTGWGAVQLEFALEPVALATGQHHLVFENRHLSEIGEYLFNAARPQSARVEIVRQERSHDQSRGEIEFNLRGWASAYQIGIVAGLAAIGIATAAATWSKRYRAHNEAVE